MFLKELNFDNRECSKMQKQEFSSNKYLECTLINSGSLPASRNVHDKKTQITILLNKGSNKSSIDDFFSRFLNFFSNFNNVAEHQPQVSYAIMRNFKDFERMLEGKEDDKTELKKFFNRISIDRMKNIFISYLFCKIDKNTFDKNEETPEVKMMMEMFFLNLNGDILDYFQIRQYIIEKDGDFTFKKSYPNEIACELKYRIEKFASEILEKQTCQNFIKTLLKKLYLQMLSFEKLGEIFAYFLLIQILEDLDLKKIIDLEKIKAILEDAKEILDNRLALIKDIEECFNSYVFLFNEVVTKILDGDNSVIFLNNMNFKESLIYNMKINPILLSLHFTVFKMKSLKKNNDDYIYSDNNLPKFTVILMEGYDCVDNYQLLRNIKNVQIISIFFDDEGLQIAENIEETLKEIEKIRTKKHFISIPLRNKKIDPQNHKNKIKSKDIFQIFELIVFPLISNYRPSLIIFSHTFSFCKALNQNISLSPKIFSIILYKLGLLANNKLIVVPIIKIQQENPEFFDYELHKHLEKKKKIDLPKLLFEEYKKFVIYQKSFQFETLDHINKNRFYLYEMFGMIMNVMSGNFKKDFLNLKPSYFDYDFVKNSRFLPYLEKLLQTKFTKIAGKFPYLKRDILKGVGKLERCIQDKTVLCLSEEIESQSQMLLTNSTLTLSTSLKKTQMKANNNNGPNDKEPTFFSNKIALIHQNEEKVVLYELFFPDKNKFFYSDQTTYCVHYSSKTIFFLNNQVLNANGGQLNYENFMADFDFERLESYLFVKPMPFHLSVQTSYLVDFSLCYTETHLFLIWGRLNNSNVINHEILTYDIESRKWSTIKLISLTRTPIISRFNASSVCFKVKNQNFMYILGGHPNFSGHNCDIYNIVDYVNFTDGEEKAIHTQLPKKNYQNNYKPLFDSQLVPISQPFQSKPAYFEALLFGGNFSKYLYNQEKKPLSFSSVIFNQKGDLANSVIFDNFAKQNDLFKRNGEGLSLAFAMKSKNFCYFPSQKKIGILPSFFSKENKGVFMEYNGGSLNNYQYESSTFQQLGLEKYDLMPRLKIQNEKQEKINNKQKFIYSMITFINPIKAPIFTPAWKGQDQPLFEIKKVDTMKNFFEPDSNYDCILIDEEGVTEIILLSQKQKQKNENPTIKDELLFHRIGFYANDLKKENFNYYEYIPSRLKSTNYTLKEHMLYILVNNEKDTGCKRIIYSINIKTIDKDLRTRIELIKVYENNLRHLRGSSIVADSQFIYVVGGEFCNIINSEELMSDQKNELNKINFSYDLQKNALCNYFATNLNGMINPYVVYSNDCLFCFNRKIISNPYLELDFFFNSDEKIIQDLKSISSMNWHYLYGEVIKTKNIENEAWNFFLIDLVEGEIILFPFSSFQVNPNQQKKPKHIPHVSFDLNFLGKVANPEGVGFLYTYQNEMKESFFQGNRKKKLVFLDFEELRAVLQNNKELKNACPVKTMDLTNDQIDTQNEFLVHLNDFSQNKENANEIYLFNQNMQKISFNQEFEQLKNVIMK